MNALLLGGGGFVGLAIAEALLRRGARVTIADRTAPPDGALEALQALPGRIDVAIGDVRDPAYLDSLFAVARDRVVWGAAITADAARDAEDPEGVIGINLAALIPVLRRARDTGVGRVLNLSSVAAYGEAAYEPAALAAGVMHETDRCEPIALYGLTKFATERVVARLAGLWRLDALSVRLSSVFGPWERKTGMRDTPSPLFQIARLAARGEPARLAAPSRRDWVHSHDVADAVVTLLEAPRPRHGLYNISCGTRWSALDFAERLTRDVPALDARLAQAGEAPTVDIFGSRERAALSIDRLAAEFDWRPRFAALDDALADYLAWQGAHRAYWSAATH
ncbi:MAG: NAD(P)-dependent oxidoreductase [Alphaproteobacteria bacterium]|nr:NAD(P)-dependent oxidoreductase [Alphaproteobacteria bacterium]